MREDDPRVGQDPAAAPPNDPAAGSESLYQAVAQIIRTAYGRDGTPEEITGYITGKRADQLGEIQQAIYGSDEAKAYGAKQSGGAPPPSGSSGAAPRLPPSLGSFLAPPMLDQGGPPGLSYIPPAPNFTAPQFRAPSVAEAMNNPGQQFRMQMGEDALQNWAAARGTLNDSSTAKELIDYGQAAGAQGYADVWNHDFSAFQADSANWLGGTVNPGMQAWQTQASAGEYQNTQNYLNAWNQFVNSQNNAKWWATV